MPDNITPEWKHPNTLSQMFKIVETGDQQCEHNRMLASKTLRAYIMYLEQRIAELESA